MLLDQANAPGMSVRNRTKYLITMWSPFMNWLQSFRMWAQVSTLLWPQGHPWLLWGKNFFLNIEPSPEISRTKPIQLMREEERGCPTAILCARAARVIPTHAPSVSTGQDLPPGTNCMPMWEVVPETWAHILTESPRFTKNHVTLPHLCSGDFIKFLTSNPTVFTFTLPREPPQLPKVCQRQCEPQFPPPLRVSHLLTLEYAHAISHITSDFMPSFLFVCFFYLSGARPL